MVNSGRRTGVARRPAAPRLVRPEASNEGRLRRRATEVQERLIPLFANFVETRYQYDTLYKPRDTDRGAAKSSILDKLHKIRSLLDRVSDPSAWAILADELDRQYNELATTCKDGGLPLDLRDTMGEYLGRRLHDELVRLGEFFKPTIAAAPRTTGP